MRISRHDATEIVKELSELIGQKINIIGSDGIIIANSDPSRVGDYHQATVELVRQNLEELVVYYDQEYEGSLAGVNLPLIVDGEIIGVVGITGPQEIVRTYGKIIKRMTEILLKSREEEKRAMLQRQAFEHFCTDWVCNSNIVLNDAFIALGYTFGFDITQPHRILMLSVPGGQIETAYETVRKFLKDSGREESVFLASHTVIVITQQSDNNKLTALAQELLNQFAGADADVFVGIDSPGRTPWEIRVQHDRAKMALSAGIRLQKKRITFFDELCLELLLDDISVQSKLRYIKKVFGNASFEDIQRDLHTVQVLYDEDGSIKNAAKRLIVHPNTLQYQLKRIEERTGYDPRKLRHAEVFGVASIFFTELGDQLKNET